MNSIFIPQKPDSGSWKLSLAGAMVGVAAGGFLVSLLVRLNTLAPIGFIPYGKYWYIITYEPAVALLGALGVWCFSSKGGARVGLLGIFTALLAMVLGDIFRVMASLPPYDWAEVPFGLARLFRCGGWSKLLRYAFGTYTAWYLCSAKQTVELKKES